MKGIERSLKVLLLGLVLMVPACGNPLDDSPDRTVAAGVGIDQCYSCHLDTSYTFYNPSFAVTIQQIFNDWSQSAHGNAGNFPDTGFFGQPATDCIICHDRNLDSLNLALLAADGAPGGSTTLRPVIGCEACHGSGAGHINASFPVPYSTPDYERCGQCHNADFDHNAFTPEGDNIVEDYRSSKHNISVSALFFFDPSEFPALCAACHTDEGARQFKSVPVTNFAGLTGSVNNVNPVQCRTCHEAHDPSDLLRSADANRSEEVATCTSCHQVIDASASLITPVAHTGVGNESRRITDTHFATSGNWPPFTTNLNSITGYAMSFTDDRACRNCHNVHSADITINTQWSASDHADTSAAGAWAHYNWTNFAGGSCQRCHTTSGVIAYLTANSQALTPYSPPLSSDPAYKPQMLHCNGCHTDNIGGLRTPGAITGEYTGAAFAFTDISGSNICMACHVGSESGGSIQNLSADFSTLDFVSPHNLAAGGTLFQAIGYEYPATYANYSFFAHDQIGVAETVGIGTEGPCIGCHLTSFESHLFQPVEHSVSGTITGITSPVCGVCHAGPFTLTAAILEEEKEELQASLEALKAAMADSTVKPAFYFSSSFPYIYQDPGATTPTVNWASYADTSTNFESTGKPNMGAAFNLNLLHHEPGAYAHNRLYVKLLVFDSIDWLDNNVLDGRIDLTSYPEAARYLQGDADTSNDDTVSRPAIF